jgi:ABC-2 type transport system permease protein
MFGNVFLKSLRDQRRALLGWGIGVVLLVAIMAALWPSIRGIPDVDKFIASYPEGLRKLFNIQSMTSGTGYMNAELFSFMLPTLFIVFGIGRGARAIAGEEESGTLEVLLVTPVTTARLVLQEAAALAVSTLILGVALFGALMASSASAGMGIAAGDAAAASLAMALLGIEYGWLALAVGAATGRRSLAIAIAATVAVAAYVLYVAGQLVDAVKAWQVVSPFYQALNGGPLGAGVRPDYAWMAVAAVAFVVAALPVFDRRDIAAH